MGSSAISRGAVALLIGPRASAIEFPKGPRAAATGTATNLVSLANGAPNLTKGFKTGLAKLAPETDVKF
jgi:hypothetical protein